MTCALQFRNVTLGYDRHPAVHHLEGEVDAGALVAVVGPNGAGKSTLFKGIVGVLKPLAGRIERGELAAQDIAYLTQAAEIDRSFPINVYDLVAMGLWRRTGVFGGIGAKARQSIEQAIAAVGAFLQDLLDITAQAQPIVEGELLRGHHHHRDLTPGFLRAQGVDKGEPVHLGHHQVEQD